MNAPMTPEKALERLEALCARSEHCTGELMEKMRKWKIGVADAEAVVYSLRKRRFVDDSRYARAFVRDKYRFNRWGRLKIRFALRAKRVDAGIIEEALEEIDETIYAEALRSLVESKNKSITDTDSYIRRQKLIRSVAARGYEPELAAKIITDLKIT